MTAVGTADRQEDLVLVKHIDRLVEARFSDGNPFYFIVDTTRMQPLGLEVRRGFINCTLGSLKPKRTIMFGMSQAVMTMIQMGQRISPVFKQLELASNLDEALKLLAKNQAAAEKITPPASQLNEREQELLSALSSMIWNSDYNQRLQQLEPDDPFIDLYHAVASLQRDFQLLQDSNARSQQALAQANIQLAKRVKEKTQQLSQTEENYQLVVESASDGIVILDEGIVRYANPQMLALLGYTWDEVFGQPVERFASPGAQRAIEDMASRHYAGENINTRRDTALINKKSEPVPVEIHATLMPHEEQTTILAFVRDMTNRKRMEQAEKDARVLAETLRDAGTILSSTLDRREIINRVVNLAQRLVPYDVCEVFLVDENTSSLNRIINTDPAFDNYLVKSGNMTHNIAEWSTYRTILETSEPLFVADTHTYPNWVWIEETANIQSWMGVPVVIRDKVIAIISLYIDKPNFYTQEHFKNIQLFAHQASLALENAWLYEEATDRIKELSILNDIGEALSNIENVSDLFETICEKVMTIFEVNNFSVIIYHMETDDYSILYWMRDGKHQPVERRNVDFPLLLGVMKEHRSLLIKTREAYLAFPGIMNSWYKDLLMESWMGVPLTSSGKVVGVISTLTREAGKTFTDEDFALFNIIGSQVSAAIEKERLRKETENEAVSQERQRLARDLHDSISQLLYSQVLYVDAACKTMTAGQTAQALDYMRQMTDTSRQALRELRLMIYELRPQALQEHGLEQAIKNRLEQVERRTGINARLNSLLTDDLPLAVETELYYIIIEALNNALKHARAENIHINLYRENGDVVLEIMDDGQGFAPDTSKAGVGLKSMGERAEKLGGILTIQSDNDCGTSISLRLKVTEENV